MKRICWAILTAFIILFGSYLLSNYPYPLFDSNKVFSYTELLRSHRHASHYPEDSVLCINLAMDKQLATAVVDGLPMGKVAVSDRSKLLRFLQAAQGSGYRYIFLDVRFPSGLDTPDDATLFSVIEQMPRLVISNHQAGGNYRIADSALLAKAALADYRMTAFNGFTRYQYLQRGGDSVALRMYREMDGGDIHRFGPLYASCHRLCHNAQFLQIPPFVMDDVREDNSLRYPYLGVHLLDWYTDEELHDAVVQIKCRFAYWDGCELKSIRYAGDDSVTELNLRELNDDDPDVNYTSIAKFLMDFHTPKDVGELSFNEDTEYKDYLWWLARTDDNKWKIVINGYAD